MALQPEFPIGVSHQRLALALIELETVAHNSLGSTEHPHSPMEHIGVSFEHPAGYRLVRELDYHVNWDDDGTVVSAAPRITSFITEKPQRREIFVLNDNHSVVRKRVGDTTSTGYFDNVRLMADRVEAIVRQIRDDMPGSVAWLRHVEL